ncbi:MAG: DUF1858 domain-containing protein [archaeon]
MVPKALAKRRANKKASASSSSKGSVTKKILIGELVSKHPEAVEILLSRGFHCIGCHVSPFETLEQGAQVHGLAGKELDAIVREINDALISRRKK